MTANYRYAAQHFEAMRQDFFVQYPRCQPEALRETEYKRLDDNQQVYLDYTGGGLYAQSQLDAHMKMLSTGVWGNPHSHNPTSQAMTDLVEQARAYVLTYFNADPDEYDVIFTPNASGSLKLIGESYPFTDQSRYLILYDNHNSVNGIREFARARGADVHYVPLLSPSLRVDADHLRQQLAIIDRNAFNLFAFPGQSNFSGVQHDLAWIDEAHEQGWHVLLDAAAFAPTNRLDLSRWKPDFVSLSFYKMFGYPTGIGALIARKDALAILQRPWFAGGTITVTSVQGAGWHYMIDGHAAFEDGTVNYLMIPAVEIGLRHLESVGIDNVHARVEALTGWLLAQMAGLKHDNGRPLVEIYGPQTCEKRGGTVAFNLVDADGHRFDFRRVEKLAADANISLRTGCFCNPGTGEIVHELKAQEMAPVFESDQAVTFAELYDMTSQQYGKYPSTIRISVGIASNFTDVYRFMAYLETYLNRRASDVGAIPVAQRRPVDTA